jgi:hypothetical protein
MSTLIYNRTAADCSFTSSLKWHHEVFRWLNEFVGEEE